MIHFPFLIDFVAAYLLTTDAALHYYFKRATLGFFRGGEMLGWHSTRSQMLSSWERRFDEDGNEEDWWMMQEANYREGGAKMAFKLDDSLGAM